MNEVFATDADSDGKSLLNFPTVSTLINSDLGLANGEISLQDFEPLDYAVRLSKLSLIGEEELNRLVRDFSGEAQRADVFTSGSERFSVLFDAVRSIDGNHQWQPFGLPYPRTSGAPEPTNANDRHFGYGPLDGVGMGFDLFIDANLRDSVFLELFPEPVVGQVQDRLEMQPDAYPFPACEENPFPLSFGNGGVPAAADLSCGR